MKQLICLIEEEVKLAKLEESKQIMVSDFNEDSTNKFYKEFSDLNADPRIAIIPIIVNSYGGNVDSLLAMIDIMKTATKPIATIGISKAMSCGSVLLVHGTKGFRFASENLEIMIHEVSSMTWGKNTEVQADAKKLRELNNKLFKMYEKVSKITAKKLKELIKDNINLDLFLSSKQAKQLGFIDHIGIPVLTKKGLKT